MLTGGSKYGFAAWQNMLLINLNYSNMLNALYCWQYQRISVICFCICFSKKIFINSTNDYSWTDACLNNWLNMFLRIGVLKNFAIFTGKHLCWNLLLIKSQGWRPATLLKRDSNTGVFLWILWNFSPPASAWSFNNIFLCIEKPTSRSNVKE